MIFHSSFVAVKLRYGRFCRCIASQVIFLFPISVFCEDVDRVSSMVAGWIFAFANKNSVNNLRPRSEVGWRFLAEFLFAKGFKGREFFRRAGDHLSTKVEG